MPTFYIGGLGYDGLVGNGVANDRVALQDKFTRMGSIILPKAVYRVETNGSAENLTIAQPFVADFSGSTLKHVSVSGTNNRALFIESIFGPVSNWTETLSGGINTFAVITGAAVGSAVLLELGTHPNDAASAHYYKLAVILANSGTTVTTDIIVPFAINGTAHKLYRITSLAENITIRNLVIDAINGGVAPDVQILARASRNITFENLKVVNGSVGVSLARGCEGVTFVGQYEARLIDHGTSTSGRALNVRASRQVELPSLVTYSEMGNQQHVNCEVSAQGVTIGHWVPQYKTAATPTSALLRASGGSQSVTVKTLRTVGNNPGYIVAQVDGSNARIETLVLDRAPSNANIETVNRLEYLGVVLPDPITYRKDITITGAQTNLDVEICQGYIRQFSIYSPNLTGITSVFFKDSNNQLTNITAQLVVGSWIRLANAGILNEGNASFLLNDARYPLKSLRFTSTASASVIFKIAVNYFPVNNDMGR